MDHATLHSSKYAKMYMIENWQMTGEKLRIFGDDSKVVYVGDSPMTFMKFTQKQYNLYLPADKDIGKTKEQEKDINEVGVKVATAKVRKGCWFIFCAFWRKEAWQDIFDVEIGLNTTSARSFVIEHFYEGAFARGRWEIYEKAKKDDKLSHWVIPGQYGAQYRAACLPEPPAGATKDTKISISSDTLKCKKIGGKETVSLELAPKNQFWTHAWEIRDFSNGSGDEPDLPKELAVRRSQSVGEGEGGGVVWGFVLYCLSESRAC